MRIQKKTKPFFPFVEKRLYSRPPSNPKSYNRSSKMRSETRKKQAQISNGDIIFPLLCANFIPGAKNNKHSTFMATLVHF